MVRVTRKNPQVFQQITARLKDLDGYEGKAGWLESAKYEDGTPIAGIAAVQEFGATINHPGGTPYKIGPDGRAIFVSRNSPGAEKLPVTKPHTIVIPPRPFMRPTEEREHKTWLALLASGARAVVRGTKTGFEVMDSVAHKAALDIAKSITLVTSPPLKAGTIAARKRARADKKTLGLLDKPLVDSGDMIDTVTHSVEKKL